LPESEHEPEKENTPPEWQGVLLLGLFWVSYRRLLTCCLAA